MAVLWWNRSIMSSTLLYKTIQFFEYKNSYHVHWIADTLEMGIFRVQSEKSKYFYQKCNLKQKIQFTKLLNSQ